MKIILSGGLGNQMFQYAFFMALKEKNNDVSLDTSLYSFVEMHNGYELEKSFGIRQPKIKYKKWNLLKLRAALKFGAKPIVYKDPHYYDAIVLNSKCMYFYGYWQTEKYFKGIEEKIRNLFIFRNMDEMNLEIASNMSSNISVSLHIRRGDYLGCNIYSDVCTEEYYTKAVDLILDKVESKNNILFYVFSDDIRFSENFIKKINIPYKIIDINTNENSYKDMYLMSKCKHNIIANSSFSWWAAWLNTNKDKIIIAPKRWFNIDSEEKYKDIIPKRWIRL